MIKDTGFIYILFSCYANYDYMVICIYFFAFSIALSLLSVTFSEQTCDPVVENYYWIRETVTLKAHLHIFTWQKLLSEVTYGAFKVHI